MSGKQKTEAATQGLLLITQGATQREAAQRVGVAPSTLTWARKRAGMERGKPGGSKQTEATTQGLLLIAQGVPLCEAAQRVGVVPSTLTRAKKRASMAPVNAGRPAGSKAATAEVSAQAPVEAQTSQNYSSWALRGPVATFGVLKS